MNSGARPDQLVGVRLAALRSFGDQPPEQCFHGPKQAIATLTEDLRLLWRHHRTDDVEERRIGTLELTSGCYLQWIGYSRALVVECSSNAFLPPAGQLSAQEEAALIRAGFSRPDEDTPNFWLAVLDESECARAAFAVVAVLTAVFGVYAG